MSFPKRLLGPVLILLMCASAALSQEPANSTTDLPPTSREEIVTLLERTTAEVEDLRALRETYKKNISKLEAQVGEYKASNRVLDAAYVSSVKELGDLRTALAQLQIKLEAREAQVSELRTQLADETTAHNKTKKKLAAAHKRELIMGAIGIGSIILRLAF